jgi:hypothetical protein
VAAHHVTRKAALLREPLAADLACVRLLASVSAQVVNHGVRVGRGVRTPSAEVRGTAAVEETAGPDSPLSTPPRVHGLEEINASFSTILHTFKDWFKTHRSKMSVEKSKSICPFLTIIQEVFRFPCLASRDRRRATILTIDFSLLHTPCTVQLEDPPLGPVPGEEVANNTYESIYDMIRYTNGWRADILRAKTKGPVRTHCAGPRRLDNEDLRRDERK